MNLRHIVLGTTTIALAAFYAVYFTDWFRPKNIQIITQIRPMLRPGVKEGAYPVAFGLNARYELTGVQVYSSKALATNELALPVWSLEGAPKSAPIKAFSYAVDVPGMKPVMVGTAPAALQVGEEYVLIVEAEGKTGKTNFVAGGKAAVAQAAAAGPGALNLAPPPPPPTALVPAK